MWFEQDKRHDDRDIPISMLDYDILYFEMVQK